MIKTRIVQGIDIVQRTKWDHDWIFDPIADRVKFLESLGRYKRYASDKGSLMLQLRTPIYQMDESLTPDKERSLLASQAEEDGEKERLNGKLRRDAEKYGAEAGFYQGADIRKVNDFLMSIGVY